MIRIAVAGAVWLALALVSGCDSGPAKCYVQGKVTHQGNPVKDCHIVLSAPDLGGGSAPLDDRGEFKFDGFLHPGEYVVSFTVQTSLEVEVRKTADVPEKYRLANTSDLRVNLAPGQNRLDLDLRP